MATSSITKEVELTNVEATEVKIGKGSFATVFEAKYYGSDCAAKHLDLSVSTRLGVKMVQPKNTFLAKCRQWYNLRHPKIVHFIGYYSKPSTSSVPSVLVMERMDMNLTTFLQDNSKLPAVTKLSILLDVAQGLKYLHCVKRIPIVHGNLTSNNILLDAHLQAKISDIGLSHHFRTLMERNADALSMVFLPPEYSWSASSLDASVDIFSYGVVMIHVDALTLPEPIPVEQPSLSQSSKKAKSITYQPLIDKMTLNLKPLVASCLDFTSRNRPKADFIFKKVEPMAKDFAHVPKNTLSWKVDHESIFQEVRCICYLAIRILLKYCTRFYESICLQLIDCCLKEHRMYSFFFPFLNVKK